MTETPSSSMRVGQYKLPKSEGDKEDASLVLYYFGATQGGSPQANIDRWIGQIIHSGFDDDEVLRAGGETTQSGLSER